MSPTNPKDPFEGWSDEELAEYFELEKLPPTTLLERAGKMGPAIIGRPLHYLAAQVRTTTDEGKLGPAIIDPHYHEKELARRDAAAVAGERDERRTTEDLELAIDPDSPIDPSNLKDPRNPWTYVTLSGAKQLAITNNVSYTP
jgi:hypothetical protein